MDFQQMRLKITLVPVPPRAGDEEFSSGFVFVEAWRGGGEGERGAFGRLCSRERWGSYGAVRDG